MAGFHGLAVMSRRLARNVSPTDCRAARALEHPPSQDDAAGFRLSSFEEDDIVRNLRLLDRIRRGEVRDEYNLPGEVER